MLDSPQHVKDLVTKARETYIDWMISRSPESATNVATALTALADELDITETGALNMVTGNATL